MMLGSKPRILKAYDNDVAIAVMAYQPATDDERQRMDAVVRRFGLSVCGLVDNGHVVAQWFDHQPIRNIAKVAMQFYIYCGRDVAHRFLSILTQQKLMQYGTMPLVKSFAFIELESVTDWAHDLMLHELGFEFAVKENNLNEHNTGSEEGVDED